VRAGHLANQLLALAKAEASADDFDRLATVDLYAVADRAVQEWIQRAIARDLHNLNCVPVSFISLQICAGACSSK